ncbi:metallophosphoesterase family protein [Stackebrandtia nassauensis]|nr:metallophosphoesterase [Stackebrandtia nassauensis]
MDLAAIGAVAWLSAAPRRVTLSGAGDSGVVRLRAHSAAGFAAPLALADVAIEAEPPRAAAAVGAAAELGTSGEHRVVDVSAEPDGIRVTARADSGAVRLVARLGGQSVAVAVTIGARTEPLTDAATSWRLRTARATGQLISGSRTFVADDEPRGQGHERPNRQLGREADAQPHADLGIGYDFTASTATRAVYADLAEPVAVVGQPTSFAAWVDADDNGALPSLDFRDAEGTRIVLRGERLTWRGGRWCHMPVPPGVVFPLVLRGFYLAETRPGCQYRGRIGLGRITAEVPPEVDIPDGPADGPLFGFPSPSDTGGAEVDSPLFTNSVTDRAWRFAVLSDTQFVAARPDDGLVAAARAMLRDIKTHHPDLVLVNGDFVDEGSPADLALARRILDEELAEGPPWVYLPGNHEIAGGDIATFRAEFGEVRRGFEHRGVRFVTLDTSSLFIGDEQLGWLRDELDRAAADDRVRAVVVAGHVPPHDPTGHQASQLLDRAEAAALEAALAGFVAASGKDCAYVAGHAGVFAAWLRDGVAYVVNGNSGKDPAAPPRRGGVLGWSECGVDVERRPRDRVRHAPEWLAVRVRRPGVAEVT